jgi:hypothetical protein
MNWKRRVEGILIFAGILFFVSTGFDIMPTNLACFLGIACFVGIGVLEYF